MSLPLLPVSINIGRRRCQIASQFENYLVASLKHKFLPIFFIRNSFSSSYFIFPPHPPHRGKPFKEINEIFFCNENVAGGRHRSSGKRRESKNVGEMKLRKLSTKEERDRSIKRSSRKIWDKKKVASVLLKTIEHGRTREDKI